METLRSDAVHTSETMCSTMSCISSHHIDELTKEKEDELLYGTGEDGDEEEALSDDSMRLRLSDDEDIETEDVLKTTGECDQQVAPKENKTEPTSAESDEQPALGPKTVVTESNISRSELKQEEQCSGNVSMDDKVVNDHQKKDTKMTGNGLRESQVTNKNHYPWPSYESRWMFPSSPRIRSFHCINRPPYPRHHFPIPNEHYRHDSYNYYNKFKSAYHPFKRGRGVASGKCAYYKEVYGDRIGKRFQAKTTIVSRPSTTSVTTSASSTNTNSSAVNGLQTDVKNVQNTDSNDNNECPKVDKLDNQCMINNQTDNSDTDKSENLKAGTTLSDKPDTEIFTAKVESDSVDTKSNADVKTSDGNLKAISISNDILIDNLKDADNCRLNHVSHENPRSPLNSLDECSKNVNDDDQTNQSCKIDSGICDINTSDNSKAMEALTESTDNKEDKEAVSISANKENLSNETQDEEITVTDVVCIERCEESEVICQKQECNEEKTVSDNNESKDVVHNSATRDSKEDDRETLCQSNDTITSKIVEKDEVTDNAFNTAVEILENCKDNSVENNTLGDDHPTDASVINDTAAVDTLTDNQEDVQSDANVDLLPIISKVEVPSENANSNERRLSAADNSTTIKEISNLNTSQGHEPLAENNLHEKSTTDGEQGVKTVNNENLTVVDSVSKQSENADKVAITLEGSNAFNECTMLQDSNKEDNTNKNSTCTNKQSLSSSDASLGLDPGMKNIRDDSEKKNPEVPVTTQRRRRRTKKMIAAAQEAACEEDKQVRQGGRQKRRTAKNAEEIIRKKFLNHDSDLESSDGSEKFVIVNHKVNQNARSSSPPSLKRNCPDIDDVTANGTMKKSRMNVDESLTNETTARENENKDIKNLNYVRKFFQRDLKERLPKLKQEELEELLIQKIVETITMRGEIGKLREQARISKKNQEATRARCQQLAKQIKDFEMVLSRNAADRRANNDKPTPPIKINRSVGLQVNFMTDHGMQNLRQLQQNSNIKSINATNGSNIPTNETNNNAQSPRRGIKIRSPRRSEAPTAVQTAVVSQSHVQTQPIIPAVTPAALVVAKSIESQHALSLSNQSSNVQQLVPNVQPQQQQSIVLNGKISNQITRQATQLNITKSRTNDLIDLTDEEEKSKGSTNVSSVTATVTDQHINIAPKPQTCFQRVIQTIPGNVAITSQPTSIRVVQPASQPTPTALVNNMNAPRLAYVMQSGVGSTRQLLITSNSSQMRPVTSCNRATFPTLTYKTGISTVANGTVRVLTTPAGTNVQLSKHPAPLPDTPNYATNPIWKLPPPAPSLKISKVANGIVLSWNMTLSDKYADIASYQLYAYQEVAGIAPSTALWKKVGDVRALPLPMACTLTQFSEGNNYYFAVRAVDTHSRKGQYSIPGNISL